MDRASIKAVADILFSLKKSISNMSASGVTENSDHDEMIENVTLAYRHLEDASMRLGKAIQAFDGGKSVYDKSTVVGA